MERPTPIKDAAVHRLAKSITQLTLCQVTTSEVDDATKLLEKARQKLQGIQNIPSQRVTDLEAAIRQLRQIGCILDSCTISASYEVTQAQKAILQLHHTARGARTSSEELNAQMSPRTDDEHNLPSHEDYLQEHWHCGAYRNRNFDADAWKRAQSLSALVAMHMDNPCEHDDWKSTTERTLSVP